MWAAELRDAAREGGRCTCGARARRSSTTNEDAPARPCTCPPDLSKGIGGHLYNLWSYLPLTLEMYNSFDIPHLEFIQSVMLAITHSARHWVYW